MEHKPEHSIGFQKFMSQVLAAGAEAVAAAVSGASSDETKQLADDLGELRMRFVSLQFREFALHESSWHTEKMGAYQAYAALRDTPEAQKFISEHPSFLPSIDHALFRCVVSIREASAAPAK